MEQSKGHLAFIGDFEYFTVPNGDLYRARVSSTYIQTSGYRSGGRWEAPPHMVNTAMKLARECFEKYGPA